MLSIRKRVESLLLINAEIVELQAQEDISTVSKKVYSERAIMDDIAT